jgi:hypothetical protein
MQVEAIFRHFCDTVAMISEWWEMAGIAATRGQSTSRKNIRGFPD